MDDPVVGIIKAYSARTGTARIDVAGAPLQVGDVIRVQDDARSFVQLVEDLQVDDEYRVAARPGESLAMPLSHAVKPNATVHIVRPDRSSA